MISINRVLSFEQYAASNRLFLRYGSAKQRFVYFCFLRVLPIPSLIGIPFAVWAAIHYWRQPGNHVVGFVMSFVLIYFCSYLALCPTLFKRRLRKLYKMQDLALPWKIEVSEKDIFSAMPGSAETRFQWAFFDSFVETDEVFLIMKKKRPIFLTLSKDGLSLEQQDELRSILAAHLRLTS